MPLGDGATLQALDETGRGDTAPNLAYVNDTATETALQQGLGGRYGRAERLRAGGRRPERA
jgi:hypothetical protein